MSQQKYESMLAALLSKVITALETALNATEKVGGAFGSTRPAGEGPQQHKEQFFIAVFLSDYLLKRMHAVDDRIPAKPPRVQPGSFVGPAIDFTPTPARDTSPDETTRAKFEGIIFKFVQIMLPKLEEMETTLDSMHRKLNVEVHPSPLPEGTGARSVLVITSRVERLSQALSDIALRFSTSSPSPSTSPSLPSSSSPQPASSLPITTSPAALLASSAPSGFASSPQSPSPLTSLPSLSSSPTPFGVGGLGLGTGLGIGGLGGAGVSPGLGMGAGAGMGVGAASSPSNDATQRMQLLVQLFSEGFMGPEEYQARRAQIEQQQQLQAQQQQLQAQQAGFGGQSPFDILTAYFTRGLISADEYQLRLSLLQQQQQQQLAGLGLGAPAPSVGLFPSTGLGAAPALPGLGASIGQTPPSSSPAGTLSQLQSMLDSGLITHEQFAMYTSRV